MGEAAEAEHLLLVAEHADLGALIARRPFVHQAWFADHAKTPLAFGQDSLLTRLQS